jgi:hypothetical protein
MLEHPSATPSLLTTTHVGIDGYPHLPRHTMPQPYRILCLGSIHSPNRPSHQVQRVYNDRVCGLLGAGETVFLCDEHVNLVAWRIDSGNVPHER